MIIIQLILVFLTQAVDLIPVQVLEIFQDTRSNSVGSLMGGYELRLKIIGLDQNVENNKIFLGDIPCIITDDGISGQNGLDGQIIRCITGQTNISQTLLPQLTSFPIVIQNNQISAPLKVNVLGKQDLIGNLVQQSVFATPILQNIIQYIVTPNNVINSQFAIKSYDSSYSLLYIGQDACIMTKILSIGNLFNYYCKVSQNMESGFYNVTIKGPSGLQYNRPESYQKQLNNQQQYQIMIVPTIVELSSNIASQYGQILKINGFGFTKNLNNIKISLSGYNVDTTLMFANETQIIVALKNYENLNETNFLQSSGLSYKKYNLNNTVYAGDCKKFRSQIQTNISQVDQYLISQNIQYSLEQYLNKDFNYGEYYRGYFKPQKSGNYKFQISAYSYAELYLSQISGFNVTNQITSLIYTNGQAFRSYNLANQISKDIYLVQDNYYLIEIYHCEFKIDGHLTVSIQIQDEQQQYQLYQPIPQSLLYTFTNTPQINVQINNILAGCNYQICKYQLINNDKFIQSNFTLEFDILQITLQSFSDVILKQSQITITFGGAQCQITSFTNNNSQYNINCRLPANNGVILCEAGENIPKINIYPIGIINNDPQLIPITQEIIVTQIIPPIGSIEGGTYLTILGEGFPFSSNQQSQFIITLGGLNVYPLYIDNQRINAITTPLQGQGELEIQFNGKSFTSTTIFQYIQPNKIDIYNLQFKNQSPLFKGLLIIYATNLGNDTNTLNVRLENNNKSYQAPIVSLENEQLTVYLRGGLPGDYFVNIFKNGQEKSISVNQSNIFSYGVYISDVIPTQGSIYGGTIITIIGTNFVIEESLVFIGQGLNNICEIDIMLSNNTNIICITPEKPDLESYNKSVDVVVVTRATLESKCVNQYGCKFFYSDYLTPKVDKYPINVSNISGIIQKQYTYGYLENISIITENTQPIKIILSETLYQYTIDPNIIDNVISYQIPQIPQGNYITFIQTPNGYSDKTWYTIIPLIINEIQPNSISQGGQLIKLLGQGFNSQQRLSVLIGDQYCLELKIIYSSQIQCRTPILQTGAQNVSLYQRDQSNDIIMSQIQVQVVEFQIKINSISQSSQISVNKNQINFIGDLLQPFQLQIIGNNLNYSNNSQIYLQQLKTNIKYDGMVLNYSLQQIYVQFEQVPVGKYNIQLLSEGVYSISSLIIYIQGKAQFTPQQVTYSSIMGGKTIQIDCNGTQIQNQLVKVNICGQYCNIFDIRESNILCSAPSLLGQNLLRTYPQIIQDFGKVDILLMKFGSSNGKDNSYFDLLFDNQDQTCIDLGVGGQSLSIEFESLLILELKSIQFTIQSSINASKSFIGTVFQYQLNDSSTWNNLFIIDQSIQLGINMIIPESPIKNIKKIKILDQPNKSQIKFCEFKIIGRLTQSNSNPLNQDYICGAVVTVNDFSFPLIQNVVQYQFSQTPRVQSVSHKYVPTFKTSDITLNGVGFGTDVNQVAILIDNIICQVISVSDEQIQCQTGIKDLLTNSLQGQFVVQINQNIAINQQIVQYGNLWSEIETWGGYVFPNDNETVVVKQGQILIVDIKTPQLQSVFVEGTLIFSDNGQLNVLDTQQLIINQGKLLIGEQNNPYLSQAQIILRGEYNNIQLTEYGNKVLGCNQCTIKLYGNPKLPVWTLLNKTIEIGDTQLFLDENVNWNIGDQIIVTSSDFDYKQTEVKTIVEIQDNLIKVDQPFIYQHYSQIEQYGDQQFQNKVEVGVLTRNIQIIGEQSKIQKQYGYHFKVLGQSIVQISYTEFVNGGQIQYQGRHSIYFKQNNNLNGGYLIGNSVHDNNARCIVLNQAKYLLIQNNICYNTYGHSILLLSGLETNNQITNNLVINTQSNYFLLQSDLQPSSFLITNPINTITGNRAAGSDYDGFKFDFTQNADYLGQDCRNGQLIKQFSNNSAHSNQYSGLNIPIYVPRTDACQPSYQPPCYVRYQPSLKDYIRNISTWNNNFYGILLSNIGNVELNGIQIVNSKVSIYIQQTDQSQEPFLVNNSLIVRYSDNQYFKTCYAFILPRTEQCNLFNIQIYNYIYEDTLFRINSYTQTPISINYQMMNVNVYNNSAKFIDETFTNNMIWDQTGTFFSYPSYIFPKKLYIDTEECQNSTSPLWVNTIYCPQNYELRSFYPYSYYDFIPEFISKQEVKNFSEGSQQGLILRTGQTYFLQSTQFNGIQKDSLEVWIMFSNFYNQQDKSIVFRLNTQQQILSYSHQIRNNVCQTSGYPSEQLKNPPNPKTCKSGQWFYEATTNDFYICVSGKAYSYLNYNERLLMIFYFIVGQEFPLPPPPPIVPNNQTNNTNSSSNTNSSTDNSSTSNTSSSTNQKPVWSNPNMWPSKQIPQENDNVTIQKSQSLILDIDTPNLNELIIYGSLIFDDQRNSSILRTIKLWIKDGGQLIAGNSTNLYKGLITIQINGLNKSQSIIIQGLMSLYGLIPSTRFSRLTEFAYSGQNTIKVESVNGWQINDIIAISPSATDPLQTEEFVISQITDKVVTLSKPLLYNHYGDNQITLTQQDIGQFDMRAIIINLSRNIKITSQNGQCQITVQYLENSTLKNGLVLNGVELSQGQVLEILSNYNNSIQIDGSTFHHSNGSFFKSINTSNITIGNTIFYQGFGQLAQLNNISKLVFKNNILMNAKSTKGLLANFIYDNIEITTDIVQVSDNIGIGSENQGFLFMTSSCQNQNKLSFFNNSCSNTMNACISYKQSNGTCDIIGQNFASQSLIGILVQLQTKQIQVKQLILIENKVNLIIMMGTDEMLNNSIFISNSYISPYQRENCTQCYNNSSTYCQDAVGIQMATISKNVNTLSFDKFDSNIDLQSEIAVDGRVYLDSVIFKGFKTNYSDQSVCANNTVFRQHPQADDMTPQHYLTNTKCLNCTQEGLLYNLRQTNLGLVGQSKGCGTFECTGQINMLIEDQDGSFFGQLGQAIANNQYFGPTAPYCKKVIDWVGYFCKNNFISVLNFMSTAPDFNARLYSPVTLTDGQFTNQINSYKEWQWNNNQPLNKRESKFVSLIQVNSWINMTNQGQNPTESIYWLSKRKYTGSPSDYLIIQLQFESKNIIQVSINGTIIKAGISQQDNHWNLSQKTNSCGANNYFNNNNTIHFVVTGDLNCLVKISLLNTIQITSRILITKAQFLGKNFLQYAAAQLGGDPYNYFIVSITKVTQKRNLQSQDSIFDIKWAIVDPVPIGVDEQTKVSDRLTVLQNKIKTIVSDSNSEYKIVSSNTSVAVVDIQTLSNPKQIEITTPISNNTQQQNSQTNNQTIINQTNQQDVNLPPAKDNSQNQQSSDYVSPSETNKSSMESSTNQTNSPQQNNQSQTFVDQSPNNSSNNLSNNSLGTPQNKLQQNSTIDIGKQQENSNNPLYVTILAIIIPFIILIILFIGYVCYRRRISRNYSIVASMKFDIPSINLNNPSIISKND